jgi:large subunit ribosomal protein L28
MARKCGITGKGVGTGHNVSHSQRKTNRRFLPNLQNASLLSDALGRMISLRVTTNAIRTIEKHGGLDSFLIQAKPAALGDAERRLKKQIESAKAKKEAKAA